ncbi:MAG: bifunctional folylpolyglutamate synthase/dihydrofolate synthase [Nitrospirae bacterium]|nr:bifunctional folylpolyglutamate synthase/dihydrofolate synthase [Nitrospirota bacterium]
MSYNDSIDYLYGLQKYGVKFGLDNIRKLLSLFNNPQNKFRSVHIAGTNGKGSTSAMVASILQAEGFKVGLFTSPHLVSFTERIKVNNEEIAESDVVTLTEEIRERIREGIDRDFSPTFFEFVTAMGFLYFNKQGVEWAVVETGMGGRLDATNVLMPQISVITNISYDHKEFLGNTLSAIAGEKAGIIKDGVPIVCAMQEKEVEKVIRQKAEEKRSQLFIYGKDFYGLLRSSGINGITFDYCDSELTNLFLPLAGKHQLVNACLAIKAAIVAIDRAKEQKSKRAKEIFDIAALRHYGTTALREGLANTRWPGRLELISGNPPVLIDGAHNPSAANILADSLKKIFLKRYKKMILILGIMADKEIEGIMSPLLPLASEIIFTAPAYERAAPPQRLAEIASAMGFSNVQIAKTVKDAIEMATKHSALSIQDSADENSGLIVITGSFYTIGEAKEALGEKGILSRLRE